jgi:hypothetical protein
MTLRGVLVRAAGPLALVVAGVAVAAAVDSSLGTGISAFLIGVGCVLALAIVFWEIGRSEDRDRAREEAERRRG